MSKTCAIHGCERSHYARGWCNTHYVRWRRSGDPNVHSRMRSMEDRFWGKIQKGPGCWNWTASTTPDGYGAFNDGKKTHRAHRLAYELTMGTIPEGMVLDHRCHNTLCANPAHLRPITQKQNVEHRSGVSKNNTTGALGVTLNKRSGLYVAQVGHNRKHINGGRFQTLEEAAEAAKQLRLSLFSHNDMDRRTV